VTGYQAQPLQMLLLLLLMMMMMCTPGFLAYI
jgi:hypothetical protein